mmetsp:Transcript_3762/g.14279  ORF Transcript_3762/g.14279 Transcript_3762/m.14279 type:complete len:96 (-) Transcript_3762:4152-4439(-)
MPRTPPTPITPTLTFSSDPLKMFESNPRDAFRIVFQRADTDGNTLLSKTEFLRLMCKSMDDELAKQLLNVVFDAIDTNHDGNISIDEFLDAMASP